MDAKKNIVRPVFAWWQFLCGTVVLGVGMAGAYFASQRQSAAAAPVLIAVHPEDLELGTVWSDFAFPHRLRITNRSVRAISIDRFETSCSCTVVGASPISIDPGQTVEIPLTIDLSSNEQSGESTPFQVKITPLIPSMLPRSVQWTLTGNVVSALAERLALMDLGEIVAHESSPAVVREIGLKEPTAEVSIESEAFSEIGEVHLAESESGRPSIRIVVSENAPLGLFEKPVVLNVQSSAGVPHGRYSIPIRGKIVSDILIDASSLAFGIVRPGETRAGAILLTSRSGKPFEVLSANSSNQGVTLSPEHGEGEQRVRATFIAPAESGTQNLYVTLKLAQEDRTWGEVVSGTAFILADERGTHEE